MTRRTSRRRRRQNLERSDLTHPIAHMTLLVIHEENEPQTENPLRGVAYPLTLYRQSQIFDREGLDPSTGPVLQGIVNAA